MLYKVLIFSNIMGIQSGFDTMLLLQNVTTLRHWDSRKGARSPPFLPPFFSATFHSSTHTRKKNKDMRLEFIY